MNPQERRIRLPLLDNISLEEPSSGSLVVSFASDIVICRGIGRRKPLAKGLP